MARVFSLLAMAGAAMCQEWSYANSGSDWSSTDFPGCYIAGVQSPIKIEKGNNKKVVTRKKKYVQKLDLDRETGEEEVLLLNTGQYLGLFEFSKGATIKPSGVHFAEYELEYGEIHWGGTEHKIDGSDGDGEMQLYFKKSADSITKLGTEWIALAVILKKGDKNKGQLEKIVDAVPQIYTAGDSTTIVNFDWTKAMPNNWKNKFYTYRGAETHPPCKKDITWYVIEGSKSMSSNQFAFFRSMKQPNGEPIMSCVRDRQEQAARIVNAPKKKEKKQSTLEQLLDAQNGADGGADAGQDFQDFFFG